MTENEKDYCLRNNQTSSNNVMDRVIVIVYIGLVDTNNKYLTLSKSSEYQYLARFATV